MIWRTYFLLQTPYVNACVFLCWMSCSEYELDSSSIAHVTCGSKALLLNTYCATHVTSSVQSWYNPENLSSSVFCLCSSRVWMGLSFISTQVCVQALVQHCLGPSPEGKIKICCFPRSLFGSLNLWKHAGKVCLMVGKFFPENTREGEKNYNKKSEMLQMV